MTTKKREIFNDDDLCGPTATTREEWNIRKNHPLLLFSKTGHLPLPLSSIDDVRPRIPKGLQVVTLNVDQTANSSLRILVSLRLLDPLNPKGVSFTFKDIFPWWMQDGRKISKIEKTDLSGLNRVGFLEPDSKVHLETLDISTFYILFE